MTLQRAEVLILPEFKNLPNHYYNLLFQTLCQKFCCQHNERACRFSWKTAWFVNIISLSNNDILTDDKFALGGRWLRGFDSYGAGPRNSRTSYVGGNNLAVTKFDYSYELTKTSMPSDKKCIWSPMISELTSNCSYVSKSIKTKLLFSWNK